MRFGIGAFLALSITASATLFPQAPFRSGIDLIQVDAVVRDRSGNPVRGLTRADFQVFEDGRPLPIESFSAVDLPAAAVNTSIPPLESALTAFGSNDYAQDGRLFVLVLDDVHVRFDAGCIFRVHQIAQRFIERLAPGDLAAVVATSSSRPVALEFTGDKPRLLAAVMEFVPDGGGTGGPPGSGFGALKTAFAMSKLSGVTRTLAMVQHRRKAVVLISEGPPFGLDQVMNPDAGGAANASAALSDLRDFIRTAQRSNVAIYAFDPGNQVRNPLSDRRQNLITIAEATGGFATLQAANTDAAVDRMVAENGAYYLLGYYSPAKPFDGKHHRITVKAGRPDVQVSAREGYVAARRPPKADARHGSDHEAMLRAPIQEVGLPMHVSLAPAPASTKGATAVVVTVEVPGQIFAAGRKLELMVSAVGLEDGKVRATERIDASLPERDKALPAWSRFVTRFDLKPERVQFRVTGRLSDGTRQGSVFAELRVPAFNRDLSVGALTLGTVTGGATTTKGAALLGVIPVPSREVPLSVPLMLALPIKTDSRRASEIVDVTVEMSRGDGTVVWTDRVSRSARAYGSGDGRPFTADLPLQPAGEYRLKLGASLRGRTPTVRELTFTRIQ